MLFVTAYLGGCHGTAKSAQDFLRALLACHSDVIVLSPNRNEIPSKIGEYELSRPEWLVTNQKRQYRRRSIRYWLNLPRELYRRFKRRSCIWCLNRRGRHIVVVNGWASLRYWQIYASHLESKKVMIVRESPRHFACGDCDVDADQMVEALAQFDGLIFVSDNGRQEWLGYPELKKIPSFYLPNCCEEEETEALLKRTRLDVRRSLGLNPDEFIILCPGTVEKRKGQDLLFDILPELSRTIPRLRLLFVGGAGTMWGRQFLGQLFNNRFSEQVTHWHFRESILDIIYASDILAFPSRTEAFPRTILEAMALKTPIVASDVDGIPEQIEDKKTGFLFHVDDKEGLLNALLAVAANEQMRADMAEAGFKRYWEKFSRQQQIKRVANVMAALEREF